MSTTGAAAAQVGPDVATSMIGLGNDYFYYGEAGGIKAFSWATTSCNVGDEVIDWISGASHKHPVIAQNLFRVHDGRIEQLGYSFLKHSFCAVSEPTCGSCQATGCDNLGIGCADTYLSILNDGLFGGSKADINATSGYHDQVTGPSGGPAVIRGRLQVAAAELNIPGAQYIAESQYVSEHDHGAGLARNNASWIALNVAGDTLTNAGPIQMFDPAIYAWQAFESGVTVSEVVNVREGGVGSHGDIDGYYFLASKVSALGGGEWRYEYALQNLTSDQSARSFKLVMDASCGLSEFFFRGIERHSGDEHSSADWLTTADGSGFEWSTDSHAQDPHANALRWGELFNFGFTSSFGPKTGTVEIGLFKPGTTATLVAPLELPDSQCACSGSFANYCTATSNSSGAAASIAASGSPSIAANDLTVLASGLPAGQFGYFMMADGQAMLPAFGGGQGNLCLSTPQLRFVTSVARASASGELSLSPDLANLPGGTVVQPGAQWNFQCWFRDRNPLRTTNTSDGLAVQFCP